jgi:hypothetical protein
MQSILYILAWLYFIISQIMTIVFWYEWAQNHGLMNTIFIGPFVAEFKGLLWPFFM